MSLSEDRRRSSSQIASAQLAELTAKTKPRRSNMSLSEDRRSSSSQIASTQLAELKEKSKPRRSAQWAKYDQMLISSMMRKPILWNFKIPIVERSPTKTRKAWTEVQQDLDGIFGITEIRKRWRNLRDSYKKSKKKYNADIASGADEAPRITFRFFHSMQFLDDPINTSYSTVNNVDEPDEKEQDNTTTYFFPKIEEFDNEDENSVYLYGTSTSSNTIETPTRKRRNSESVSDSELENKILTFMKSQTQKSYSGFFTNIEEMMKELPVVVRAELQVKILNLTLEAYNAHRVE